MRTAEASVEAGRWGKSIATASWVSVVIAIVVNSLFRKASPVGAELIAMLFILLGFVLGVTGLVRMAWEGRKGILVPALIGTILSALLVLIFVTNFIAYSARGG